MRALAIGLIMTFGSLLALCLLAVVLGAAGPRRPRDAAGGQIVAPAGGASAPRPSVPAVWPRRGG